MSDNLKAFCKEIADLADQTGSFTGGAAHVFRELRVILKRYNIEPAIRRISEPGLWAVVEASCVHSDVRRHWVKGGNGNWYPVDNDETAPDDWDSLIDPALVRAGVGFVKVDHHGRPADQVAHNLSSGVNAGTSESPGGTEEVPDEAKGRQPCAAAQSHEWVRKYNFMWDGHAEPPYEVCEHCFKTRGVDEVIEPTEGSVVYVAGSSFIRLGRSHFLAAPHGHHWFGKHPRSGEDVRLTWSDLQDLGDVKIVRTEP